MAAIRCLWSTLFSEEMGQVVRPAGFPGSVVSSAPDDLAIYRIFERPVESSHTVEPPKLPAIADSPACAYNW